MDAVAFSSGTESRGAAPLRWKSSGSLAVPSTMRCLTGCRAQRLVQLGIDQQHRAAGVLQDVADLFGVEPEVHRHQDASVPADPEEAHQEARGVGGHDRDALVLADAEIVERRGQAAGHLAELA